MVTVASGIFRGNTLIGQSGGYHGEKEFGRDGYDLSVSYSLPFTPQYWCYANDEKFRARFAISRGDSGSNGMMAVINWSGQQLFPNGLVAA